MASILSEMTKNMREKVEDKSILLIEDSTELSFGLRTQVTGIGKVGTSIEDGFYSHPVIVLDTSSKHCVLYTK